MKEGEVFCACGEDILKHTDEQLNACAIQFGYLTETGGEISIGQFEGEYPDPAKRAARRREFLKRLCSCGRRFGEHIPFATLLDCLRRDREK